MYAAFRKWFVRSSKRISKAGRLRVLRPAFWAKQEIDRAPIIKFCYMKKLLIAMMTGLCVNAAAQDRPVSGLVLDASTGEPLAGASVYAADSRAGTITDSGGHFALSIPGKCKELEIAFIGYEKQVVAVSPASTYFEVLMKSSSVEIDQVIVIGYGTAKKSDLTGSVSSIGSKDLVKSAPASLEKGLQGRISGVNVVQNDGAPGSGISVQIRGTNSFLGGTEPLYVVDGIPITTSNDQESINFEENTYSYRNALSFLDPNDIESIEVLKDASSTAIYGSRGANGVILITTKSGAGLATNREVSLNYNFTISKPVRKIRVLNGQEYARYRNESYANTETCNGNAYKPEDLPFPGMVVEQSGYVKGPEDYGTDPYYWQNQIFRTALSHNVNLTISGQGRGMDYSLSGSCLSQEGTVINSDYNRYSFKISFNDKVNSWLKIGTSTNISYAKSNLLKTTIDSQSNGTEGVIRSALMYPSVYTVDDEISKDNEFSTVTTPTLYTQALNEHKNINVYTSNYANMSLTKHLIFRSVLGWNYSANDANQYWPVYLYEGRNVNGKSYAGDTSWSSLVWDNLLMYNQSFGKHNIAATLGSSWEESHWYNKRISVQTFGTDITNGWLLQDAATVNTPNSSKGDSQLFSIIMRASYNYANKYYVTFTGREDYSSKFAKGNRSSFFPSIGVSYRVSDEKFMDAPRKVIDNLKIRYSYGTSGNQAINPYQTFALMKGANYPFGNSVQNGYAPDPSNPGNASLKWETTRQHDVGLELGLLNRIDLTADYYHKRTEDLLQYKEVAYSTGLQRILSNAGCVVNTGWEVGLNVAVMSKPHFTWNAGANISFNRNHLADFNEEPMFPNSLWNSLRPFALQNGHPIGSLYGFVEDGIWNSREEIINSDQFQAQYPGYTVNDNDDATEIIIKRKWLGEIRYKNFDDDPNITDSDQTYIGNTNPDFFYGLNMDFKIYNFDLSFLFQGVQGNDILNMNRLRFCDIGNSKNIPLDIYREAWKPGEGGTAPKNFYDNGRTIRFSRRYVEDGSYLKLRNLQLGYTINKPFKGVSSIRAYVTMNNLFTITDYSGYDHEVNSFGSDPSLRGVDSGGYPQARSAAFGVNLTF